MNKKELIKQIKEVAQDKKIHLWSLDLQAQTTTILNRILYCLSVSDDILKKALEKYSRKSPIHANNIKDYYKQSAYIRCGLYAYIQEAA